MIKRRPTNGQPMPNCCGEFGGYSKLGESVDDLIDRIRNAPETLRAVQKSQSQNIVVT